MSNPFTLKESVGRIKATNLLCKYELDESKDAYAVWDLSGSTEDLAGCERPFFIEVKDREVSSTDYETIYLEFIKYQHLLEVADANGEADIFYLSFFTDKVGIIHNLRKLKVSQIKLAVKKVRQTTVGNYDIYVDKVFIELPVNQGRKYLLKNV